MEPGPGGRQNGVAGSQDAGPAFPGDDVDPAIRDWLSRMFAASAVLGSRPGLAAPARRAIAEVQREPWRSGGPVMASSETLQVGDSGTRIRIHRPRDAADLPVLVYLHGGGWTLFSIETHDRIMREYAARAGVAVLGIDYPLAPEHPYPSAPRAIAQVLEWMDANGSAHGLEPLRWAIGGDSAGANLALAAAQMRRAAGRSPPRALLLNYGAFDGEWRDSYARYGDGDRYMLTGPEMDDFWRTYVGSDAFGAATQDPLVRPILADLHGLPPTWLCVAQCDILLDENVAMAGRLSEAGVDTQIRVYPGATHSFLEAVAIAPLAVRALDEASHWLAAHMA